MIPLTDRTRALIERTVGADAVFGLGGFAITNPMALEVLLAAAREEVRKDLADTVIYVPEMSEDERDNLLKILGNMPRNQPIVISHPPQPPHRPWDRCANDQVRDLHVANNALLERARMAEAELDDHFEHTERVIAGLNAQLTTQTELATKYVRLATDHALVK